MVLICLNLIPLWHWIQIFEIFFVKPIHTDHDDSNKSRKISKRGEYLCLTAQICREECSDLCTVLDNHLKIKGDSFEGCLKEAIYSTFSMSLSWCKDHKDICQHTLASKKSLAPMTPSVETLISDSRAKAIRPLSSCNSPAAARWKISRNCNTETVFKLCVCLKLTKTKQPIPPKGQNTIL